MSALCAVVDAAWYLTRAQDRPEKTESMVNRDGGSGRTPETGLPSTPSILAFKLNKCWKEHLSAPSLGAWRGSRLSPTTTYNGFGKVAGITSSADFVRLKRARRHPGVNAGAHPQ